LAGEIRSFTQRTAEFLRYFYACFPVATTPGARERLPKLHGAMTKLQGELEAYDVFTVLEAALIRGVMSGRGSQRQRRVDKGGRRPRRP